MFNIEEFLKRFEIIKDPTDIKKDFSRIIESETGQKIDYTQINIQGDKIILNTHPAIKAVIFTKKEAVLNAIKKEFPEKRFVALF